MSAEEDILKRIDGLKRAQIKINGYTINYVYGGTGYPVLLIHGLNIGWGQWYLNIPALLKRFSVYAIDLPGAGKSTSIEYKTADLTKDFLEIVEKFIAQTINQPAHIIGHSFGGWIALKLALKNPALTDKTIVVNSLGFSNYLPWGYRLLGIYPLAKLLSQKALPINRPNMRHFLESVGARKNFLEDGFVDYYYESVSSNPNAHPFLFINRLISIRKIREELSLHGASHPSLVIWGALDPLLPLAKNLPMIKANPSIHLKILESIGHTPNLEAPSLFNELAIQELS